MAGQSGGETCSETDMDVKMVVHMYVAGFWKRKKSAGLYEYDGLCTQVRKRVLEICGDWNQFIPNEMYLRMEISRGLKIYKTPLQYLKRNTDFDTKPLEKSLGLAHGRASR
jgi:hypothetical protein